jgi:hypothetical protein
MNSAPRKGFLGSSRALWRRQPQIPERRKKVADCPVGCHRLEPAVPSFAPLLRRRALAQGAYGRCTRSSMNKSVYCLTFLRFRRACTDIACALFSLPQKVLHRFSLRTESPVPAGFAGTIAGSRSGQADSPQNSKHGFSTTVSYRLRMPGTVHLGTVLR